MPYDVSRDTNACPQSAPWAVKDSDGAIIACHISQDMADRHVEAIVAGSQPSMGSSPFGTMDMNAAPTPETRRGFEERGFAITEVEVRGGVGGKVTIGGYASTFNQPYMVHDRLGQFSETILPGAWSRSLQNRGEKIHMLVAHGGIPLAAAHAGTLRLAQDDHGLEFEGDLNPKRSKLHEDVAFAVESRAMDEMSVGMQIPASGDSWNDDNTERAISEAKLIEISVLGRGANPNTEAGMRADDLHAEFRRLRALLTAGPAELARAEVERRERDLEAAKAVAMLAALHDRRRP